MASFGAELSESTFLKKFGAWQHPYLKHLSACLYCFLLCMSLDRHARLISENVYNRDAVRQFWVKSEVIWESTSAWKKKRPHKEFSFIISNCCLGVSAMASSHISSTDHYPSCSFSSSTWPWWQLWLTETLTLLRVLCPGLAFPLTRCAIPSFLFAFAGLSWLIH